MNIYLFDVAKCVGCFNCQVSCKDEHCGNDWMPYNRPAPETGQFWCQLLESVRGSVPKVKLAWILKRCNHCDDPECIPACPVSAIYKRDDGIVIIDPAICNGCRLCITACPYDSISFNESLGIAQKCTGCSHIIDRGWPITQPRCVDSCPTEALRFGDEGIFGGELDSAVGSLNPEFNTKPRAYYLNLPKKFIAGTVYDPNDKEVFIGATCTLSGDSSATTKTDEFGDFWFDGLEVGVYSVKIEADGKSKTIPSIQTDTDRNLGNIELV